MTSYHGLDGALARDISSSSMCLASLSDIAPSAERAASSDSPKAT
jgi:hypothetical protein